MQIQISWLLQKPTDLDLHCLQRQGISGFSRTRVKVVVCQNLSSWLSLNNVIKPCIRKNWGKGYSQPCYSCRCDLRGISVKPGLVHLGYWQTVQTQIRHRRMWHLIRVCTVCLNYRNLRVEGNSLKSPFRTIFPAYTQRQSTQPCRRCFDIIS